MAVILRDCACGCQLFMTSPVLRDCLLEWACPAVAWELTLGRSLSYWLPLETVQHVCLPRVPRLGEPGRPSVPWVATQRMEDDQGTAKFSRSL